MIGPGCGPMGRIEIGAVPPRIAYKTLAGAVVNCGCVSGAELAVADCPALGGIG